MRSKLEKKTYMQKRADDEIRVVQNVVDVSERKIYELDKHVAGIKAEMDELGRKIVRELDQSTKKRLMKQYDTKNKRLATKQGTIDTYSGIQEAVEILLIVVESYYDQFLYKEIVKIIPARKFDKMVMDIGRTNNFFDFIVSVYDKFIDYAEKKKVDAHEFEDTIARMEQIKENMDKLENQGNHALMREDVLIKEIEEKYAQFKDDALEDSLPIDGKKSDKKNFS